MQSTITLLAPAIATGLTAGFSPGPLSTLVVSETLKHGIKGGFRVAIVPLVSDPPVALISLLLFQKASSLPLFLGSISLFGAIFLCVLGFKGLQLKSKKMAGSPVTINSFRDGVVVNLLSPYPYLFWFSVGGPMIFGRGEYSIYIPLSFIATFYSMLVISKFSIAILVNRSRRFLSSMTYLALNRLLAIILLFYAFLMFQEGYNRF